MERNIFSDVPVVKRSTEQFHERFSYINKINKKTRIDVAKRVISDIRSLPESNSTQFNLKCLKALKELSQRDKQKPSLVQFGIAPVLLMCLQKFPNNIGIANRVFSILKELGGKLTVFLKIGFLGHMLTTMNNMNADRGVQMQSCYALVNLCYSPPVAEYLTKINVGDLLCKILTIHQKESRVCVACVKAVALFCKMKHKEDMWVHGLGPLVLKVMKEHKEQEKIQEYGCSALLHFQHTYTMARLSAVSVLLTAVTKFGNNERLVENACGALKYYSLLKENLKILTRTDVAATVVKCMGVHQKNQKIQLYCCLVIWHFGLGEEGKRQLMTARAGQALLNTINANMRNTKIICHAFGALASLARTEDHAKSLNEDDAEDVIISAIEEHSLDEELNMNGFCAMRNLLHYNLPRLAFAEQEKVHLLASNARQMFGRNEKLKGYVSAILDKMNKEN